MGESEPSSWGIWSGTEKAVVWQAGEGGTCRSGVLEVGVKRGWEEGGKLTQLGRPWEFER